MATSETQTGESRTPILSDDAPSVPAPHEERPPDQRQTDIDEARENARDAVDAGETEPLPEERHREPPTDRPEREDPPSNDPAVQEPVDPDKPEEIGAR